MNEPKEPRILFLLEVLDELAGGGRATDESHLARRMSPDGVPLNEFARDVWRAADVLREIKLVEQVGSTTALVITKQGFEALATTHLAARILARKAGDEFSAALAEPPAPVVQECGEKGLVGGCAGFCVRPLGHAGRHMMGGPLW